MKEIDAEMSLNFYHIILQCAIRISHFCISRRIAIAPESTLQTHTHKPTVRNKLFNAQKISRAPKRGRQKAAQRRSEISSREANTYNK